jgi:predicted O-methyltransferase YrrM
MMSLAAPSAPIQTMSRAEFDARFGTPNVDGALCGYTLEVDTRTVLTLLVHARPRRVLEVGTALGDLTRWTTDDAQVFTIDIVQGMARAAPGATAQQVDVPGRADWGRFADHFGRIHKVFFITADTMRYDFGRLAPLDFVFIDGEHDLEHMQNDSRKAYNALAPGGWLVWHDFNSPVPWVKVREAIEGLGFAEPVVHVEGTEVAFLRKQGGSGQCRVAGAEAYSLVPQGGCVGPGTPVASVPSGDLLHSHPASDGTVRVVWEGDVEGLHSLAIVNRALCMALIDRGHDLGLVTGMETQQVVTPERLPLDPRLAARLGRGPSQVNVRPSVAQIFLIHPVARSLRQDLFEHDRKE